MFNHFHLQASFDSLEDMEKFVRATTWTFANIFNRHYGLKGPLFHHPYGSAPKYKPQKIAENLIYIANNPVEKKAVSDAWDYRWNFLRYAPERDPLNGNMVYSSLSRHPFSKEFDPFVASNNLLYLVKIIKTKAQRGEYIDYEFYNSEQYKSLDEEERNQLIDIIIGTYNVIDYGPILKKYGSISQFRNVLKEIQGNEYDINDDWEPENYRNYMKMITISSEEGYDISSVRFIGTNEDSGRSSGGKIKRQGPKMPLSIYQKLVKRFRAEIGATDLEIAKFLDIEVDHIGRQVGKSPLYLGHFPR